MNTQKILLEFEPKKENLLPAAKAIQKDAGFVSEEAIERMAEFFDMAPSAVFSAVSFYDKTKIRKPAEVLIKICDSSHCSIKGAEEVINQIELFFRQRADDDFNPKVNIQRESCMGNCLAGPVVQVNGVVFERVTPERVDDVLRNYFE